MIPRCPVTWVGADDGAQYADGSPLRFDIFGAQALGGRDNQEDSFAYRPTRSRLLLVAAVSDGMGGHRAGEVASRMATDAVVELEAGTLRDRFGRAQDRVRRRSARDMDCRGMGATLTALALTRHGRLAWCHVGDSRLLRVRGGEVTWLTDDHSVPGQLFRAGHLSEIEFENGEGVPGLCAFIGMPGDFTFDEGNEAVEPGDVYLLVSDGVCGPLKRWVTGVLVEQARAGGAKPIAETLVTEAVRISGKHADNATTIALVLR